MTEPALATMQMPRDTAQTVAPIANTFIPSTNAQPISAPPEMPPDHRYEYGVEIARGGMGRVVEATDTVLGRTVAVKEALSLDPEAVRRFHRETRITARLEHPSIVPYSVVKSADGFFILAVGNDGQFQKFCAFAGRPERGVSLCLLPSGTSGRDPLARGTSVHRA